jgi:lipopolysaccharide transport system permease protein
LIFPVSAMVANMINLLLSMIPLALIMLFVGHPFHWTWIYLPVPLLALSIFTLGVTFLFATANVYYRDVSHIVQILLQAWFYVTPIIYAIDMVPPQYQWVFRLNPLLYIFNGFRLAVYDGQLPRVQNVIASFACALVALIIGYATFRKHQSDFVFYL